MQLQIYKSISKLLTYQLQAGDLRPANIYMYGGIEY